MGVRAREEGQSLENKGQNSPGPPGYFGNKTLDFRVLASLPSAAGHPRESSGVGAGNEPPLPDQGKEYLLDEPVHQGCVCLACRPLALGRRMSVCRLDGWPGAF